MRKVTFGVANSLDNYIARKDDAVDWLFWSEEVTAITAEFWKTVDTVVMGRRTYEVALKSGTTSYPGVKNYVVSRTMKESPDKKVEIISAGAAEFVRNLKNQEGKGICVMGGGLLAKSLFEANLISRYHFGGIKVYRNHLRLGFLSSEMIVDARIQSVEKLGHQRAGYHVKLSSPREVDDQLLAWLEKAYHLQS